MIRHGEVHKIDSIADLQEHTRVTTECLVTQLPDQTQDQMIKWENKARQETDEKPIHDAAHAHSDIIQDCLQNADTNSLITNALRDMDAEYVHLYDGTIHTIVRLPAQTTVHNQSHEQENPSQTGDTR